MEFYELIQQRKSVRKYHKDKIPEDMLSRILEAARIAPSAKNIQPWRFVVVRDPKLKLQVAEACRGQLWMADADVIICGCALEKIAYGHMGGYMKSYPVDLGIAMDHLILAAHNEGLGTCWIGAFEEGRVKQTLGIPDDVRVVALTPIGFPAEKPKNRGRKPLDEIIAFDKY